jgi:hypothetical protein
MKRSFSLLLGLILLTAVAVAPEENPALATWVRTIDTGEDLPVIAAWAPGGGQLAYGTEVEVSRRKITVKDDREIYTYPSEVWVTDFEKEPKRILKGKRFRNRRGVIPSFSVTHLAWAPDGEKLAVELTDRQGESATFLLTPKGKRVKVGDGRANLLDGYGAGWLGDSESVGIMHEALNPRLLHRLSLLRVTAGRELALFREKTFAAADWMPKSHKAVLIERDRDFAEPPRLLLGDLDRGTAELIEELEDGYLGGLQATPDETIVSYFEGQEKLAVRAVNPESSVEHWPIPLGRYAWTGRSNTLLYLEPEDIGSRKGWLTLYNPADGSKVRVLSEQKVRNFWLAPDGKQLAVLTADDWPELRIYRLSLPASPSD